ncbi:MAG TPA: alcohol dehydrogenase catalytic domain-containing protein [Blastocatellia bacterium]|nr:alcohol dehydrogenase catalytic domain-containing protein [Blastocatellia bacterium]
MRACVLSDVAELEVRDVTQPEPGPYDVLVRVSAVGLCGTDFHIFEGHANYNTDDSGAAISLSGQPQILGHEIAGVIEEVGKNARDLHIDLRPDLHSGDRVVLDQGLNCKSAHRETLCEYCATGDSHQCEHYREHGITGLQGGLAEYIAVPAVNAVRIDSDIDLAAAAVTEPLGCILHSSQMAGSVKSRYSINSMDPGRRTKSILVFGAGPAGLLFIEYLRNVSGFEGLLIVSEPNAKKRSLASSLGAMCIDPNSVDIVGAVHDSTHGRGVEYLIEASGSGKAIEIAPRLIRKQATVLLYGHGHAGVDMSVINRLLFREPVFVAPVGASGGFDDRGRPVTYIRALQLIEQGRINVGRFITHRYSSLEEVPAAFRSDHHSPDYVKGVVVL